MIIEYRMSWSKLSTAGGFSSCQYFGQMDELTNLLKNNSFDSECTITYSKYIELNI